MLNSSVGRVFLAHLPRSVTDPVVRAQHAAAEEGPPDREALLAAVRDDGATVTSGGVIPGIASVAAPVLPPDSVPSLAVAVALPARLADPDTLAQITDDLLDTTRAMAALLHQERTPRTSRVG